MEAIGPNIPWTLSQVRGGKSFQLQNDLTSIAFRSNSSSTHWILRGRCRDFIAGVSESSSEYDHSVDYEHEHRDAEHEHDEEPGQTMD